ncbi:hypothetical protein CNECB9_3510003 [Cupriavidus necator]|uniref:Uncharacterized protein n=1 Tax=Cupriavidus necator TaxID=106590 RepID=A0A1K0JCY3_CUPNE|nr:hypothetical protein CNECB9_3510003 [Cupriavidus necator]
MHSLYSNQPDLRPPPPGAPRIPTDILMIAT